MDRDVYLILVGAGISLTSSVITLLLQFFLGLIQETSKRKREEKERYKKELREELMRKDIPIEIRGSINTKELRIPSFLNKIPGFGFRLFGQKFEVHGHAIQEAILIGFTVFCLFVVISVSNR